MSSSNIKTANEKLNELLNLQEEHKKLSEKEKQLRNYLDINVFDYATNKSNLEDIFSIDSSKLKLIENIRNSEVSSYNVPLLEISNLTKYYGSKVIPSLVNISLKVYLGDVHVVVGNYGSGKTTLFKCLLGSEPYHGEIAVDGNNALNNPNISKICGFVSEKHKWDAFSTVEEALFSEFDEIQIGENYAKKYIRSALEQFNMSDIRNSNIIDLSLVQIKQLQIIVALINDPHLLALDQPLLGLQYFEKLEILTILAKLRSKDRAILIFTHEMDELSDYANSISLLVKGKLFYSGLIKNLLLPQNNKFAIKVNQKDIALQILNDMECKNTYKDTSNTIYAMFDGQLNTLMFQRECAAKNVIIESFKAVALNIEDLYPTLLKKGTKEAIREIHKIKYFSPDR